MRVLSSRKGFSLVELLTVIAIIAILAAIIFPVMGVVKQRANQNKCLTQLHEIGMAVQMFKQDNRKYPDILSCQVVKNGTATVPFNQCGANPNATVSGLYPEYVKATRSFHCPNSREIDTSKVEPQVDIGGIKVDLYAYDSYDFYRALGTPATVPPQLHYMKSWATTPADVQTKIPDINGVTGDPQRDYERQLKFRNPPEDTVITWCSFHEDSQRKGFAPTVFLDGHADALKGQDVENAKWRVLPKKE